MNEKKTNWTDMINNNAEAIRAKVAEMIADASAGFAEQQDLYMYPDGDLHLFANPGGNSWIDDDHEVLWTCAPGYTWDWETEAESEDRAEEIDTNVDWTMDYITDTRAAELDAEALEREAWEQALETLEV